jgi:hypothetical protein
MAAVGLPYAPAGFDDEGYYVRCPVCDLRCRPTDLSDEDGVTKSAGLAYAKHFDAEH